MLSIVYCGLFLCGLVGAVPYRLDDGSYGVEGNYADPEHYEEPKLEYPEDPSYDKKDEYATEKSSYTEKQEYVSEKEEYTVMPLYTEKHVLYPMEHTDKPDYYTEVYTDKPEYHTEESKYETMKPAYTEGEMDHYPATSEPEDGYPSKEGNDGYYPSTEDSGYPEVHTYPMPIDEEPEKSVYVVEVKSVDGNESSYDLSLDNSVDTEGMELAKVGVVKAMFKLYEPIEETTQGHYMTTTKGSYHSETTPGYTDKTTSCTKTTEKSYTSGSYHPVTTPGYTDKTTSCTKTTAKSYTQGPYDPETTMHYTDKTTSCTKTTE